VAAATLGDTIQFLDSSTYTEAIDLRSSGYTKQLDFEAAPGQTPVWSQPGSSWGLRCDAPLLAGGDPLIYLKGIKFTNWNSTSLGFAYSNYRSVIRVEDCIFEDCNGPIAKSVRSTSGTHAWFKRCKSRNCGPFVDCAIGNGYINIENCDIHTAASQNGLDLPTNTTIFHTTVLMRNGISNLGLRAGEIRNCIVKTDSGANAQYGIRTWAAGYSHNCVNGSFSGSAFTGTDLGGNITVDPLFTDEGAEDYSLQPSSPCIDSGTDAGVTDDFTSFPRPENSLFDMGAYEYKTFAVEAAKMIGRETFLVKFNKTPTTSGGNETDATVPSNWTVTDPDGRSIVVVSVTQVSSSLSDYLQVQCAKEFIVRESYTFQMASTVTDATYGIAHTSSVTSISGLISRVKELLERNDRQAARDLNRNQFPRSPADIVKTGPDGDYALTEGTETLRKLLIRRTLFGPNSFWHLPNYGAGVRVKEPLLGAGLSELRQKLINQYRQELEVKKVNVLVYEQNGVLFINPRVTTTGGQKDLEPITVSSEGDLNA